MSSIWKIVKTEIAPDGALVELRYAEFGKGRAKTRTWKLFRDGREVGYASTPGDAEQNFARVLAGMERNQTTGRYEPRPHP